MNKFTFLILLIFLSAFWIFWLPGVRVANDYHLPHDIPTSEQIIPWIWRETNVADGLGEYTGITLWAQPLHSFFSIFSALSIPPSFQTKLLGSLVFIIGFLSLSKLYAYHGISGIGKYIGIVFYLTNSYFILLFDGGQVSLALIYAISPLLVYIFLKMPEGYKFKYKLYLALLFLVISILDIRFVYLLGLLLFLNFIFQLFLKKAIERTVFLKESILGALVTIVVLVSFHIYWLLPSVLIKPPQLPQTYGRVSQVDFLSFSSVGHALLLQQPHWYKNIFGQVSNLQPEFILIPILVFLAPILRRKDKVVGFWLIIAALGIFLSKGSQPPFGQIYPWLFSNIPFFSFFRDPTKFYLLTSLSFSVLMAITLQEISSRKKIFTNRFFRIIPVLVLIYLVWLIRPVYLGQMTGLLSQPPYAHEYSKLKEYLREDENFSRVFWIPTKAPLGYASNTHPAVEAARFAQKRPFATGISGSYETFNYIRDPQYMGQLFDVAGIGYIAYPYLDARRADMHPDNIRYYYIFADQLSKRSWLSKVNNSAMPLYKVKEHQDRFFITPNIWFILGSDNIYNEATKSAQLKLSKNALIFVDEQSGLGKKINELPSAKIVLNNKNLTDLAASFIESSKLIFPARQLDFEPDKSGWWKREAADLISWRDFLQTKYGIDNQDFDLGGGWAVGEGNLEFRIKNLELRKNKILLARVLESTRSGELSFHQNGQSVGKIVTKNEGNNVRWFEVGQLPKNGEELEIKSFGDINVVNALAVLNNNEWISYKEKAKFLQGRIVNFDEKNAQNDNNPKVTYQKINPTKYKVSISNLTRPAFLVFSQNYDGLWKLDGQSALPVYSLLNGFKIEKNGQYTLEFEAQKYVFPGLVISGLTAVIFFTFFIFSRYKR